MTARLFGQKITAEDTYDVMLARMCSALAPLSLDDLSEAYANWVFCVSQSDGINREFSVAMVTFLHQTILDKLQ